MAAVGSFIIAGCGEIRLPDRYLGNCDIVVVEYSGEFDINITGEVLGRRGDVEKRRKFVKILMIQSFKQGVGFPLKDLEINTESCFIQLCRGHGNFDLPVMTVQVFTISLVIDKAMSSSK
jgi:hypothetical protein